jgi:hypothetical protein
MIVHASRDPATPQFPAGAAAYGQALEAAFDLHRFDLLTALHLPSRQTSSAR